MEQLILSTSFYNFISGSNTKVGRILYRLYLKQSRRATYVNNYHWRSNILNTKEINYITMRPDGQISFLPAGKPHKTNDAGDWQREGRQDGRPSKVIKKLFHPRFLRYLTDKDFENFANNYKSKSTVNGYTFELWDSTRIKEAYKMKRVDSGKLGGSCMNDDVDYMDIYHHCKSLQILVLLNSEGKLCGRALVWNIAKDVTLMDRVYTCEDHLTEMYKDYATDKKWFRKYYIDSNDSCDYIMNPEGVAARRHFRVDTPTDFSQYPWIDTFHYGGDGFLTNEDIGKYCYDDTGGGRSGDSHEDGMVEDEIRGGMIDGDDAVNIDRGNRRYRDRTTHIDNTVEVHGYRYYEGDDTIVECSNGDFELRDDCVCCEDGEWRLEDECVLCADDQYRLEDDCVECADGQWREEYECVECEDGEFRPHDECVEIDGDWYAEDSDDIECINGTYKLKDAA